MLTHLPPSRKLRSGLLPVVAIAGIAILGSPAAHAQNYLHTSGARILDSQGNAVRITGINWFGFETTNYCPHGLWARSMSSMLDQIKGLGYNTLRVPFCSQMFDAGSAPNGIDFGQNPDLQGLTPIQILDKLIADCQARGLKVILDRHRPDSNAQSALWYTSQYSEQRWISDWQMLAGRYHGNDTVIGCDLHNEPHSPSTWGDGSQTTDWRLAAQRCGDAIQAINPHLLIFVEGIEQFNGDGYWWGGNLEGVASAPVQLNVANQLVYSVHDYPSTVGSQPWFSDPSYPSNLPGVWDKHWGYIAKQNIAPVWIGEFGTLDQTTSDQQWFSSIASYIAANQLSFTYWCWNPNSGDTGGILQDDWNTVNTNKQSVLQPLLAPLIGSGASQTLSDGTYKIAAQTTGDVLDCYNTANTNGTIVQLWGSWNTNSQRWSVHGNGDGTYAIRTINPDGSVGRSLDCTGCSPGDGTQLELWDYWGGPCQAWRINPTGGGAYSISTAQAKSDGSYDVLDGNGCSGADGTRVILWSWGGGGCQQQWRFIPAN
ncbi:endoglucanase [Capsulimonas corticalis]|uniref:cellulase n=2 Tax=Capsulimonas corticalis TaxID=2219043 RepID=A0A402CR73_9BACT|nr:endoglucanase [Capsulimonas corticalis]